MDAHWASHAEKPVHLLRVAFTKIAAEHAKVSPEAVLALAVRSVDSMKTSTGLSRLEIDCNRPARHPPLSEELFALLCAATDETSAEFLGRMFC
jgi:hypothetical protein